MMTERMLLVALTGLLPLVNASARELSLAEALPLAVQHSHKVKQAAAETAAAEAMARSAGAARLPTLSIEGRAFYRDDVPQLNISLPLGQQVAREIGSKENYQTDLRLILPLFTGGKIMGGIGVAEAAAQMQHFLQEANVDELRCRTRREYLALYRAQQLVRVSRASRERSEVIHRDVLALFAAGAADSTDLLETELALAESDLQVKEAVTRRRVDEISLAVLLDISIADSIILTDSLSLPDTLTAIAGPGERSDLRAADASISLYRAQLRSERSGYFPALSVYGGYSYGKPNLDLFNKTWNDYFTVGAQVSWSFNLGWQQRYDVRGSHFRIRAAQHRRDELAEAIDRQVALTREQIRLAFQQHETARRRFLITRRNYELASIKHRAGVLSSNRLIEIEASLSAAEAQLTVALVDVHLATADYLYARGSDKLKEGF